MNAEPQNGWQNMGRITQWLFSQNHQLTSTDQIVYLYVAQQCAGYRKTTTPILSYTTIADNTNISYSTIQRSMKKLLGTFVIKVATNHATNIGKVAYAYQLKFRKNEDFPYIDTGRDKKTTDKEMIKLEKEIYDRKSVDMDVSDLEEKLKQLKENE